MNQAHAAAGCRSSITIISQVGKLVSKLTNLPAYAHGDRAGKAR